METMQRKAMSDEDLLDALKAKVGEATGEKLLVLYASETGNTADLAKSLAYELKRRDQRVQVMAMDDLDVMDLPNAQARARARRHVRPGRVPRQLPRVQGAARRRVAPRERFLDGVKFATFGMGDSGYVFYNSVGQHFHNRFAALGAAPIKDIGLGDDQDEDKWGGGGVEWAPELYDELGLPPPPQEMLPASCTLAVAPGSASVGKVTIPFIMPRDTAGPSTLVPMETSRPLTPGGRDVRHYEFNIKGTGLTYDAGDALAIFSTNGADRVDDFLSWYGMARDDVISIEKGAMPLPNHFTAGQLFTEHLDIFGRPKRNFIEMLGLMATAPDEREALQALLTKEEARRRKLVDNTTTTAEMLRLFPSAKVPLEYLLDFVPAIKPRLYDRVGVGDALRPHPHVHRRGGLAARRRRDVPRPVDVVPPQPDAGAARRRAPSPS